MYIYIEMRVHVSVPVVLVQSFDFEEKELPLDSFFPAFTRPCTRGMLFTTESTDILLQ